MTMFTALASFTLYYALGICLCIYWYPRIFPKKPVPIVRSVTAPASKAEDIQ
ncbi:MAG: hypothetical protein Q4B94_00215 [Pseudomonadota bacterium]|nr:hypothetical protein [Pseudomonadota bacterium]